MGKVLVKDSTLSNRNITFVFYLSDATSDLASILAPDGSSGAAPGSRPEDAGSKSNYLSSESGGQHRVRSLSDSRSDGQKKQSKTNTYFYYDLYIR